MRDGRRARLLRAGLVATVVALALAVAGPASGARERTPPAPLRGWVVDRARFEPVTAGGLLQPGGSGAVRGAVDVVSTSRGVAVVNEVALDDYVRGVAEVPSTWPLEALRAQAIAARTFALHQRQRTGDSPARAVGADICATPACQLYIGVDKERSEQGERWVEAVASTSGQVLLYGGEPILAKYSSSNGGRSVAGGLPYLPAANDPDSALGPYGRWRVSFAYGSLGAAFGLPGPLASLRRVGDSVVLDWAVPGGASGQTAVAVPAFRDRLNDAMPPQADLPRAVPSDQFSVLADDQAGTATLDGRGNGHGVGMSQFGALAKAGRGLRAGDILASYYGGLRPVALSPEQLPGTIRVALDTGRSAVTMHGTGRFRVLNGAGEVLAVAASGAWRMVPAGGGRVRVVPPLDQEGPPTLDAVVLSAPGVAPPPGVAAFTLGAPAQVRVRVEGPAPSRAVVETAPVVVEPGPVTLALPVLPGPGRYTATVAADVGGGRVTAVSVPLELVPVAGGTRPAVVTGGSSTGLPRPAAVAVGLLCAVVGLLARRSTPVRWGSSGPSRRRRSAAP